MVLTPYMSVRKAPISDEMKAEIKKDFDEYLIKFENAQIVDCSQR